jgi:hypothetical protein
MAARSLSVIPPGALQPETAASVASKEAERTVIIVRWGARFFMDGSQYWEATRAIDAHGN